MCTLFYKNVKEESLKRNKRTKKRNNFQSVSPESSKFK